MDVVSDCCICGEHKKVNEILKDDDGKQKVIFMCDDCINWLSEVVKEAIELHCEKCANYNIGDGVDNIEECYGCKYYHN